MGGAVRAIENGFQQREIQQAAYEYQKAVESKSQIVVGVNDFGIDTEEPIDLLKIDPIVEKRQKDKLAEVKQARDDGAVDRTLKAVTKTAGGSDNLLPSICDAVGARATLGEVSDAMREAFGEFDAPVFL